MSHEKILKLVWQSIWDRKTQLRVRLSLAVFFSLCIILIDVLVPLVLRWVVNMLSIPKREYMALVLILASYGLIWSISRVLEGCRELLSSKVLERGVRKLSLKVFSHLHSLSPRYHYEHGKAGFINDVLGRVENALPILFWDLGFFSIPNFIQGVLALGIVGFLYGLMFALILGAIFAIFMGFTIFMEQKARLFFREVGHIQKKTATYIADSFLNFETIKYFSKEEHENTRCDQILTQRQKAREKKIWILESIRIGQGLILGLGLTVMTLASGYATVQGQLTIGDFVLLNGYLLQFITPLTYIGYLFRQIREALTDLEQVDKVLSLKPEIQDDPHAVFLRKGPGEIVFENVAFGYDAEHPILQRLSFKIPAGQTVAVVGPTGSGKSTLPRLLFRFYNLTAGRIVIDGQDIAQVTQQSLHEAIGIVPQEALLFDESLYYNVAYGNLEASEEEVIEAMHLAQLGEYIARLPQGVHTIVGQRGVKLSGGERQRISIARVLLKKPKIFVFDEATSALDTETEKKIQLSIRQISKGKTTLIIAHRLSTIADADKIIVLKNGEVIEEGTHDALLEKEGFYAMLWEKQSVPHEELVDHIKL